MFLLVVPDSINDLRCYWLTVLVPLDFVVNDRSVPRFASMISKPHQSYVGDVGFAVLIDKPIWREAFGQLRWVK